MKVTLTLKAQINYFERWVDKERVIVIEFELI